MATWQLRLTAGVIVGLASSSAFAPDFSVLLGGTSELQLQLEREAAKSARGAQAFGASLSATDRRALQGACTALVADPNDSAASARLEQMMARYKDNSAEAIVRFCLEPTIARLQTELQASRRDLERMTAAHAADEGRNVEMQRALDRQRRAFTTLSNIMKTKHDTAKNSISNVR